MDDLFGYVPAFEYISRPDSTYTGATYYYKMQIGYYWLNKFIGIFSTSYYWLFFFIGCLTSLPYAYIIKRYSPILWLSCLLYFMGFPQSTYVLRQYSAVGLTIMMVPIILSFHQKTLRQIVKKYKTCLRLILLGLLFAMALLIHPTSILFVFAFCAYFIKDIKWFFGLVLSGGLALYFLLPVLALVFVENTQGYGAYLEADADNQGGTLLINGFCFISSLIVLRPYRKLPDLWFYLLKIQCIIFAFSIVSMAPGGGVTIPRLLLYLTCFNCIFNAYIAKRIQNKLFQFCYICITLFFVYYTFALSSRVHFSNYNIILF